MKPNIILIMTDQHRLDTFRYANPDTVCVTPNLDKLAAEGLCFTNAYTVSPVCTPARSALHSGLYPAVTGMCTNIYQEGCITNEIADKPYLLSRRLGEKGYACGFTGKWHLGVGKDKSASSEGQGVLKRMENGYMGADAYLNYGTLPTDIGFIGDDFPGHGDGGNETPQFYDYLNKAGLKQEMKNHYSEPRPGDHSRGGIITTGEETSVEYFLAKRAKEITAQLKNEDKPFFLSLNFWGPHEPYYVLEEDYNLYKDMEIPPHKSFTGEKTTENRLQTVVQRPEKDWDFFENNLKHYYAAITNIDRQLGRLFDYLKAEGLYEDSYIILSADHGDSQGCHNGLENKSYHMYDEIAKIPFILKPPKGIAQTIVPHLANTCDMYATVLDIAGETRGQQGISVLPYLRDAIKPVRKDTVMESVGAFPIVATQRMYRRDNLKYVFHCSGRDELYDMEVDPFEMHNLVDEEAAGLQLHSMKEGLAEYLYQIDDRTAPFFCKMNQLRDWAR